MRHLISSSIAVVSLAAWAAACGGSDKTSSPASDAAGKVVCTPITDGDFPAAQSPNACTGEMYASYGGNTTFMAVTKEIITAALLPSNEAILGSSFQTQLANASTERQAEFALHLQTFIESVYSGGTVDYPSSYPSMVASHANLGITLTQYNAFITQIIVPVLQKAGVSQSDITNCFAPPLLDPATMKTVVTCK